MVLKVKSNGKFCFFICFLSRHEIFNNFFLFFLLLSLFIKCSTPCAKGKMISTPKSIECIDCVIGRHQNINGQASCLPCIPGKAINVEGSEECSACAKNSFSALTLSTNCLDCDVGRTTLDATGSTSCTICAAGTYGLGCKNCEVGQYRTGGDDGTSGKREQQQLIFNVRSFNILTCSSFFFFFLSFLLFFFFLSFFLFNFSSILLFLRAISFLLFRCNYLYWLS